MMSQTQGDNQVPPWAPPLRVTQESPKKTSRAPWRPFTNARGYFRLFKKRKSQVFKVQETLEAQEVVNQNF